MSSLSLAKVEVAHLLQANLAKISRLPAADFKSETDMDQQVDIRIMLQVMGGILTETAFFFEAPDETLQASITKLSCMLGCDAYEGELPSWIKFEPHAIDQNTEMGRELARLALEDWQDCEFQFHDMLMTLAHHMIIAWEEGDCDDVIGIPRQESFRLLIEYATRAMSYEIAAQELCDVLIEKKISRDGWTIGDCLGGLAGAAGWRLAKHNLLQKRADKDSVEISSPGPLNDLDDLVYVMTKEATRMGVPAGSDWRFGLAANDCKLNPPLELLNGIEPYALLFFSALPMPCLKEQAVACAKAAGRMVAVAAVGEEPEIAHVIAKPLAMAAITETYKTFWTGF